MVKMQKDAVTQDAGPNQRAEKKGTNAPQIFFSTQKKNKKHATNKKSKNTAGPKK